MANKISRCNICGEFFNSKKELKEHKDKIHRITSSKLVGLKELIPIITITMILIGCLCSNIVAASAISYRI
jgi:hypothetical protein